MVFLEIVMILIGMGAIIYSSRMADRRPEDNETSKKAMHVIDMDTAEQMEQRLQDYQEKIENIAADAELQTEDKLKDLSNESIMGISEYSDQVLDKIEKNHAEVVFLYNMLNEKQEEIKEAVTDADKMKAELRDELSVLYQENQVWIQEAKQELQEATEELQETMERSQEMIAEAVIAESSEMAETVEVSVEDEVENEERISKENEENIEVFSKQNEILELYKKGHSVLEISKLLSIGQGEAKFVIDLYGMK